MDFELVAGTLGGRFTTIEGLLNNIKDQLTGTGSFLVGDSMDQQKDKLDSFMDSFDKVTKILTYCFILKKRIGGD